LRGRRRGQRKGVSPKRPRIEITLERATDSSKTSAPKQGLRTAETARILGVSVRTLEDWRYRGCGPVYHRVGKLALYYRADLERWLAEREVTPDVR